MSELTGRGPKCHTWQALLGRCLFLRVQINSGERQWRFGGQQSCRVPWRVRCPLMSGSSPSNLNTKVAERERYYITTRRTQDAFGSTGVEREQFHDSTRRMHEAFGSTGAERERFLTTARRILSLLRVEVGSFISNVCPHVRMFGLLFYAV